MDPKRIRISGILFGFMILYLGNMWLASHTQRMKHLDSFSQVHHPQNTSLIDSLSLEVEYYPATYVDDSFRFKSAYLVGELRSYAGDWDEIKNFYGNKILGDVAPIMVMPVEVHGNNQQTWLDTSSGYSFSPFEADILSALNNHSSPVGTLKSLTRTEQSLYFVYSVW